jgi:hypothetical protein
LHIRHKVPVALTRFSSLKYTFCSSPPTDPVTIFTKLIFFIVSTTYQSKKPISPSRQATVKAKGATPMASNAQITANQLNARHSTGAQTAKGKARVSTNALKLGLFSMRDFVRPEEIEDHELLTTSLWLELAPATPCEQTFATEIIRATWRLHRCNAIEADLAETAGDSGLDPIADESFAQTQKSIERARAQATNALHKAMSELRRLKAERPAAAAQPSGSLKSCATKQTHSPSPVSVQQTPRNALCPCNSGMKFKRCCGQNAPPVLNFPDSRQPGDEIT